MTHVLHRALGRSYPVAARGEGIRIVDAQGRSYVDASGGAAVSCLGHDHPDVRAAMRAQIDRLAYAHTSFFTTQVAEELAEHMAARAPAGLSHIYFVSGGSEAVEAALKLARQYYVERGEPQRRRFVARRLSYHGNTLGALAVGGNERRRAQFAPLLAEVARVSACYAYRERAEGETPETYGERLARELEAEILALGPETVIAFVAETVGGATAGAIEPVPGYLRRVREVCDRHDVLLVLDEVMCGMGRTGALHACAQEGVVPDLMTVAKGLAAGYAPIGAVYVSERIVAALARGSGLFQHGHTYVGHAVACAAALATQRVIERDGLLDAVAALGERLARRLAERFGDHPHVGDARGRGLLRAIELVEDRATKAPFDPALALHARIRAQAMERGLLVYPMGGTIDGVRGDHVLLAPPFVAAPQDMDDVVERLGEAVDAAIAQARA